MFGHINMRNCNILVFVEDCVCARESPFLPALLELTKNRKKNGDNPILVRRIFCAVEPTIWHLGNSTKYEWPIHRAQWSRLAMALPPTTPPPSFLSPPFPSLLPHSKQYSPQQSWHFSPEINKVRGGWVCVCVRGTRGRP